LRAVLERRRLTESGQHEAMFGRLSHASVVALIRTMERRCETGVLTLLSASGAGGRLFFRNGELIDAKLVDAEQVELTGIEAVVPMLSWSEGHFQLAYRSVECEERIAHESSALILDWIDDQVTAHHLEHDDAQSVPPAASDEDTDQRATYRSSQSEGEPGEAADVLASPVGASAAEDGVALATEDATTTASARALGCEPESPGRGERRAASRLAHRRSCRWAR
jgi:hypothetical protein